MTQATSTVLHTAAGAAQTAAQGAGALAGAQQVGQVALNNVPNVYSVPRMIHTKAVPIMVHPQAQWGELLASIKGLPFSAQNDKVLEFIANRTEEVFHDLLTAIGDLSPENFKTAVRGFISSTIGLCDMAVRDKDLPVRFFSKADPFFWDKVQANLISIVMKLDHRKLFSHEELVKIVEANIRLSQRMAFLN
jgi:hypothetical protein